MAGAGAEPMRFLHLTQTHRAREGVLVQGNEATQVQDWFAASTPVRYTSDCRSFLRAAQPTFTRAKTQLQGEPDEAPFVWDGRDKAHDDAASVRHAAEDRPGVGFVVLG